MDRNTVIGLLLMGVLFFAFLMIQQPKQKEAQKQAEERRKEFLEKQREQFVKDSLESVRKIEEIKKQDEVVAAEIDIDSTLSDSARQLIIDSVKIARKTARAMDKFGPFKEVANGTETFHVLENELLHITFTTKGGKVKTVKLKNYKNHKADTLILVDGDDNYLGYSFYYDGEKIINTDSLYFEASLVEGQNALSMKADLGEGRYIEQFYSLAPESYLVDYDLRFEKMNSIIPPNRSDILLNWQNDLYQQEKNRDYAIGETSIHYGLLDGDVDWTYKEKELKIVSSVKWVSFTQTFFNTTLIAGGHFDKGGQLTSLGEPDTSRIGRMQAELYIPFNNDAQFHFPMQFYFAPNHYSSLKKLDLGMHEIVPLGQSVFKWVNRWLIIPIFNFLGGFIGNYGIIILILTILIKLVLTPLTYKSYLSMAKMKVLKPELDELREKHGKDQQRMSQEQMKLYRQAGVNPLGGCIPMLLQMPLLIAMYRFFPTSVELRQESFLWADDLSTYDSIINFGFTIPLLGDHLSLFTVLMTATSLLMVKMNAQMTNMGAGANQMKVLQYIFPVMLLFIFNNFASALTYYYLLFNLFSFGQQLLLKKFFINDAAIHAKIQENKKKPKKKSKFQQRLEDIYNEQQKQRAAKQKGGKKRR